MTVHAPTPTPWLFKGATLWRAGADSDDSALAVCVCSGSRCRAEGEANAAFIAEAVNNHDALVDALTDVLTALDASRGNGDYPDFEAWEKKARTVLDALTNSTEDMSK